MLLSVCRDQERNVLLGFLGVLPIRCTVPIHKALRSVSEGTVSYT